jgi:PRTRC genetic system protein E
LNLLLAFIPIDKVTNPYPNLQYKSLKLKTINSMETNFFKQLNNLKLTGNTILNIQSLPDGTMTVSILLINNSLKDKSANQIPPLILKGSVEELDLKFFETISTPIKKTNQLLCNMNEHEQALKNTQSNNNTKANSGIAGKDKDGKRKRFDEQIKKVNDLEKLNKIGEAIGQVPDAKIFPEFEEEIKTKMQQLRAKHGTLSLFGENPEEPTNNSIEEISETNSEEDPEEDDPEEIDPESEEVQEDDEFDPNR